MLAFLFPRTTGHIISNKQLKSAFNQTYDNIEIVVSDNSDNNATELVVQKYQALPGGSKIRYIRNSENNGPIANQQQSLNLAKGEFINYLMDDDLFHPQKIQKMMVYMLQYPDVTLVTSQRRVINSAGRQFYVPPFGTFKQLYPRDTIVDGRVLTRRLEDQTNYLGEPTTVLFRRKDLLEPFGMLLGKQVYFAVDLASWLHLLSRGKGVYMVQPLSYLRYHSQQLSQHEMAKEVAKMDIETFKNFAKQQGYASDKMIKDFENKQQQKSQQSSQKKTDTSIEKMIMKMIANKKKKGW
ncbi:glycosyltransferase family 2 protein [Paenibacillus aceris]|uniref:Glycosyltransferase involved in cell wall biosynthesis n=1 Tax=Paenibacillus aceris TaxID=869555 RepID=A0ABS4HVS1_9BACL|nr:glycosyltransferase family 2 protein [Paenibacillus aceris]MBP1962746.1 glycosyltransferase involved in cell wall biosynthesis [Paenibacillus aceris]NHW33891.1 glycosyltransferase [Paenibacillus aceris]